MPMVRLKAATRLPPNQVHRSQPEGLRRKAAFLGEPPAKSVLCDNRAEAAKAVVHPDRPDVDILADIVPAQYRDGRCRPRHIAGAREQVVVFDRNGPVRRKAEFKSGPDRTAPTDLACPVDLESGRGEEGAEAVVDGR